jgi:hypothetical protein
MQDFLSGETINLSFRYGEGDEPIIPDIGSVTYTVFDHSGSAIAGLENVPITTGASTFQSTIEIPAIHNTIDPTKNFERRTVVVRYQKNSLYYYQRVVFRIIPFLAYTITAENVRTFLGVNKHELPDSDIDLFASYLFVREAFTDPSDLTDALLSGTQSELLANEAIVMRAAIDIIPSLQNRVAQSEKDGVRGFDRIKIKDFSELLAEAYRRYNGAIALIGSNTIALDYTLLVTTQDADPITGGA